MVNILYFGDNSLGSTSAHRANALIRLGHTVSIYNPSNAATRQLEDKWFQALHYRTGYRLLQKQMISWVKKISISRPKPDLVWVDGGELFGNACVRYLKSLGCPVLLYNVDDPTGKRDGRRFDSLIGAISLYDLVVVVRKETAEECNKLGAKQVMRVFRSYDEVAHHPFESEASIPVSFKSGVAFIGTWMRHERRDEFILELIKQGIPVSIWGDRWAKSPHWNKLQHVYRGGALSGCDYVAAIQGAKVCLGFLSKGNRDLHTQRSLEVPFAGGLLCAERTSEHLELYEEDVEAVFWSNVQECVDACKLMLANDSLRADIRLAGKQKVESLSLGNEDICRKILDEVLKKTVIINY